MCLVKLVQGDLLRIYCLAFYNSRRLFVLRFTLFFLVVALRFVDSGLALVLALVSF